MKKITTMILVIIGAFLIIWDVIAIMKGGTEASISSIIIGFTYKMPMFTFFCGFLSGHLFWRMRSNNDTKEIDKK
jgi:cytochrome c oxidase assembly factor CtaG